MNSFDLLLQSLQAAREETRLAKETASVTDPHAMRTWVDSNLRDALIVDEKKVKEYALKIGAVDGTQVTETAKAQIASDLS